jgi:hypothetical protein
MAPEASRGRANKPTETPTTNPTQKPSPTGTLAPRGEIREIPSGFVYLGDKSNLALGFNMNAGGSIGSLLFKTQEMIDRADYGRYIQLSLYDGADEYKKAGNDPFGDWGWNPVQAGSKAFVGARVHEFRTFDNGIYIKASGQEWGEVNVESDVIFETWAWLRDGYFDVYVRSTHIGSDYHTMTGQEFPAAYFASNLSHQFGYTGSLPFTGQPLSNLAEVGNYYVCPEVRPTENWLGYGSDNNHVLVLAEPPQPFLTNDWALCLFTHVSPYVGYLSPKALFDNSQNAVREVHYYLIPGSAESARALVYDLIPHTTWTFDLNSQEGWRTQDNVVVEKGIFKIEMSAYHRLESFSSLNVLGTITPSITIKATTTEKKQDVCLQFITAKDKSWDSEKSTCFTIFPGEIQTYSINLADNPYWSDSVVTQLGLILAENGVIQIDSIIVNTQGIAWEFETNGDLEGFVPWSQLSDFHVSDGVLFTRSTGGDPHFLSSTISVNAIEFPVIEIRMRVSSGTDAQLFFTTDKSGDYNERKSIRFKVVGDNRFHIYRLDMSKTSGWESTITQIRLDPIEKKAEVEIDYIRITSP